MISDIIIFYKILSKSCKNFTLNEKYFVILYSPNHQLSIILTFYILKFSNLMQNKWVDSESLINKI